MSKGKAKGTAKAVQLKDLSPVERKVRNAAMTVQRGDDKLAKVVRELFNGAADWTAFQTSIDRVRSVLLGGEPVRGNPNKRAYDAVSQAFKRVRETVAVALEMPVDATAKAVKAAAKAGGRKAHAKAVKLLDGAETLTPAAVVEAKAKAADKRDKVTRSRWKAAKAPTAKVIPGGKDAADAVKLAREAIAACGLNEDQTDRVVAHLIGLMESNERGKKGKDAA